MAVTSSIIFGPTVAVVMVINQKSCCMHVWWGLCAYPSLCPFHALTEPWAASVFVVLICCVEGPCRVLMWWICVLTLSSFQLVIFQQASNKVFAIAHGMCSQTNSQEWIWDGTVLFSTATWLLPLWTNTGTYWQVNSTGFMSGYDSKKCKGGAGCYALAFPLCQVEFLPSQRAGPLRPHQFFCSRGRLESDQPLALVYYTSWTEAGAGAKGKAGVCREGRGRWEDELWLPGSYVLTQAWSLSTPLFCSPNG